MSLPSALAEGESRGKTNLFFKNMKVFKYEIELPRQTIKGTITASDDKLAFEALANNLSLLQKTTIIVDSMKIIPPANPLERPTSPPDQRHPG